jgi:hypothetical protein
LSLLRYCFIPKFNHYFRTISPRYSSTFDTFTGKIEEVKKRIMSTILRPNNPQLFDMNNRTKSIYWLICNNVKNGDHTKDLPDTAYYSASMLEYDRQCNLISTIQSTVESSCINSSFSSPNAMNDNDESPIPFPRRWSSIKTP